MGKRVIVSEVMGVRMCPMTKGSYVRLGLDKTRTPCFAEGVIILCSRGKRAKIKRIPKKRGVAGTLRRYVPLIRKAEITRCGDALLGMGTRLSSGKRRSIEKGRAFSLHAKIRMVATVRTPYLSLLKGRLKIPIYRLLKSKRRESGMEVLKCLFFMKSHGGASLPCSSRPSSSYT